MGTNVTEGCAAVRARTTVDAARYPWSAIGRINFAGIRVRMHCTGTLIAERLVLTAAHCLYIKKRKKWIRASQIHFVAGFQRGKFVSHSKAVRYTVSRVHDTTSNVFRPGHPDDWALIELRHAIGSRAGYLGWEALTRTGLDKALRSGARIALAGYPAIRAHAMSAEMNCRNPTFPKGAKLFIHRCAAMKGDSGAPLLLLKDGEATVVAVLSGGFSNRGDVVSVSVPVVTFRRTILRILGHLGASDDKKGPAGLPGSAPSP